MTTILLELDSSDTRDGHVQCAFDLARFARPFGARFLFCGPLDRKTGALAKSLGICVVGGKSRRISKKTLPLFFASTLCWAARLQYLRPDIVHLNYLGWGPSLGCAAHLCRIPLVARAGGYTPGNRANRWIDAYIASCAAQAEEILDSPLAPRVHIAGSLFNPERLKQAALPGRPLPSHTGRPRFLFIGRPEERKGIWVLLEAFARIQTEADLMLVGGDWNSPGLPQQLRARARQLGVAERVSFENHRPDVGALLEDCDVFVLPSLCDTRPRAIIEAMHKERPVISTKVRGIPTLVEDGVSGLLTPPSDVEALTAALERLARSEKLRKELGKAALERARRELSLEQTIKNYLAVYNSLLSPKSTVQCTDIYLPF